MTQQPERLTMEQFMPKDASIQVFSGSLRGPTGLHWHEFYEITHIVSGEGTNDWNGQSYPVGPGSTFLLTPADFHHLSPLTSDGLELINIIFSEDMLDDELRFLLFSEAPHLGHRYAPEEGASADFAAIWNEANDTRPKTEDARKLARTHIAEACPRLSRIGIARTHQGLANAAAGDSQGRALHGASFQGGSDARGGGEAGGAGLSFRGYLQQLRVRFAKSLLLASESSITEICYASGFNTLAHFERGFREKTGMSPIAFRKQADSN
ncbi:AraC family transcriptional regulator [Cohnella sp. GbtcB17]|uniref:AraC family transcriptional regulator n=1 Tax=Cohnella sp. GbtcB17 TaxID=2824762 RepID=UPI001C2F87BE|nr:AraC family transcriptional regulator [Cohnella sp. GbtcB17]